MKCYRVWFRDGSAMIVDAESPSLALKEAELLAAKQGFRRGSMSRIAKSTECLDIKEVKR